MRMPGYPHGVPNSQIVHFHPYPTRYHGGDWTRPAFKFPFVKSPQSVFKPDNIDVQGLGSLQVRTRGGVFRPGGRGGGIFDGNIAGLGSDDPMPWMEVSPTTKAIQSAFNSWAQSQGLPTLTEDGKLGGGTCGALKYAQAKGAGFVPPPSCQSFSAYPPGSSSGGGGGVVISTAPSASTPPVTAASSSVMLGSSSNKKALAFAAGGLAVFGAVYWYTKKKH